MQVYVCIHIDMCECVYVRRTVRVCMYVYLCVCICIQIYMYTIYVNLYTYIYVCVYVCMYVYEDRVALSGNTWIHSIGKHNIDY